MRCMIFFMYVRYCVNAIRICSKQGHGCNDINESFSLRDMINHIYCKLAWKNKITNFQLLLSRSVGQVLLTARIHNTVL